MNAPQATPTQEAGKRKVKSPARRVIYFALICAVLYFVGWALVRNIRKVSWGQISLNPWFIGLSFVAMLGLRCLAGLSLHVVLDALDSRIEWRRAMAIGWIGNLARYIPGKVATVASQIVLLKESGVRPALAVTATFLVGALAIPAALIMATPLLFMHDGMAGLPGRWLVILLIVVAGFVGLHPHVFIFISNIALRKMGRKTISVSVSRRKLLLAAGLLAVKLSFFGTGLWLVARSLVPVDLSLWPYFVAAASCARLSTLLAFFTPAGLGVREGMYLLILGPVIGPGPAALVAIVARLVAILSDLVIGGAALRLLRRSSAARG